MTFMRTFANFTRRLAPAGLLALGLAALPACDEPVQDDFRDEGGISPDPVGVITGSVAYLGPRPHCAYGDGDTPTRVVGRVVMTLFFYNNPAPPEGRASSAENLYYINGDKLFTLEDCLPKGQAVNPAERITRSVDFRWPGIPLSKTAPTSYQIRGFYDADEDMNPFFRVRNLPTAGDIGGGAVIDFLDPNKGFLAINFPTRAEAPNGFIRPGITVGLNTYIWTERPAFKLNEGRFLDASQRVPVAPNIAVPITPNVGRTIRDTWDLAPLTIELLPQDEAEAAFDAGGLSIDWDNQQSRAFYTEFVDVRTIVQGGPDIPLPDGEPDPHPVLGATTSLGIEWRQPMVLLQRSAFIPDYNPADAASRAALANVQAVEAAAKIPGVAMVGTPLYDEAAFIPTTVAGTQDDVGVQRTFTGSINVAVPPVAVVDLNPANAACRIPYLAAGTDQFDEKTSTQSYESRTAVCQDLPTGVFGVNVLSGVAGGALTAEADPAISDNGRVATATRFSSQVWSLPNELADPAQFPDNPRVAVESQGWNNLFVVHDPDPDDVDPCLTAIDPELGITANEQPINFRGICAEGQSPYQVEDEDAKGVDTVSCLPQLCCDAVAHLCDVPLCEVIQYQGNHNVRRSPTSIVRTLENGVGVPNCIPFALPSLCCPTE